TAFSGVGVILIVVAALALTYWWVRNIRHGRRARDLIPVDVDGHRVMEEGVPVPAEPVGPPEPPVRPEPVVRPDPAGLPQPAVRPEPAGPRQASPGPEEGPVPAPMPPEGAGTVMADPPDGSLSWLDEDPVIAEFFSSPAPVYPSPAPGRPRRR
ncbi:MAG: hypothetical protein M3Y91_05815, partial [Actinomycetota bacterium]|nr:hypothetical protein [Actinomycetota bacterium]